MFMWFIFALLSAVFQSANHLLRKKVAVDHFSTVSLSWFIRVVSLIIVTPFAIPDLDTVNFSPELYRSLFIAGTLTTLTTIAVIKVYQVEEISQVIPLINLSPVFILATSFLILGEVPSKAGFLGVILVVLGAYVLNANASSLHHLLAPFKALFSSKGARLMLLVAFTWSITANYDKIGVQNSSPIVWVFLLNLYMVIVLTPISLMKGLQYLYACIYEIKFIVAIAIVSICALVFQMLALEEELVSYVISIKHLSSIITIVLGWKLFHEHNLVSRLTGGVIMMVGAIVIVVSSL